LRTERRKGPEYRNFIRRGKKKKKRWGGKRATNPLRQITSSGRRKNIFYFIASKGENKKEEKGKRGEYDAGIHRKKGGGGFGERNKCVSF